MKGGAASPWLVVAAVAASAACAQPKAPPGGQPDKSPPRVVSVTPLPFDTLKDLDDPVVIRFDERISEHLEGVPNLRSAVLVSPETGAVKAKRGRRAIEISLSDGWQRDLVYRVVVLPVLRDLFNNRRTTPIELVFSTGAPFEETGVAGFVRDRLTGKPVAMARVEAVRGDSGPRYVAVTDTAGFFAMRYVPAGTYDVRAWLDPDGDRAEDFAEPQDTAAFSIAAGDTAVLEMALLPRDSTPARLVRAEPVDSVQLRLQFDDFFAAAPVAGQAAVFLLPDSVPAGTGRLVQSAVLDSIRAAEQAVADSARAAADSASAGADTARAFADTARAFADTTRVRSDTLASRAPVTRAGALNAAAGGRRAAAGNGSPTKPLPSRELILLLDRPLIPDTTYVVSVSGATNIRDVPGGGGSVRFRTPRWAPADTAAASGPGPAPRDSAGSAVPPGAVPPSPDTGSAVPPRPAGTLPPDTGGAMPQRAPAAAPASSGGGRWPGR